MTSLEKLLASAEWTQSYTTNWTTVKGGIGFCLYRHGSKMWLCGYPPSVVEERCRIHGDEAPYVTTYKEPWVKSIFNIPATDEFVALVVLRHYPELTNDNP